MTAAVLITADGAMTRVDVADQAEAMAKLIDCDCIDIVRTPVDGLHLVVDDDGLITHRKPNVRATLIAGRHYSWSTWLVGDALLIGVDAGGNTVDVPQDILDELEADLT